MILTWFDKLSQLASVVYRRRGRSASRRPPRPLRPLLEQLEPRYVFDANPVLAPPALGPVPVALITGAGKTQQDIATNFEGETITLDGTQSEAFNGDPLTYRWTVSKNGVPFGAASPGANADLSFVPDDNGLYNAQLIVTNTVLGTSATDFRLIQVKNVNPTVSLQPVTSATAGQPVALTATIADPGLLDSETYQWQVISGTGQVSNGPGGTLLPGQPRTTTFPFVPPSIGEYTVLFKVTDNDQGGGAEAMTFTATGFGVSILAPQAPTPEGTPIPLHADPGQPTSGVTYQYAWTVQRNDSTYASGTGQDFVFTPQASSVRSDDPNGVYTVSLTVMGSDGSSGTATAPLTVTYAAPTADIIGVPASSPAGTTISLTGGFDQPGTDTDERFQWNVSKDGVPFASATTQDFTFTPDDSATYDVAFTVTSEGGTDTAHQTVTVFNGPPAVTTPTPNVITLTVTEAGGPSGTDRTLLVTGTNGPDSIVFTPAAVTYSTAGGNGTTTPLPAGLTRVLVEGLGGDDLIDARALTIPVVLDGGAGNDTLIAESSTDVTLYGGDGNDSLVADGGADITLFGGAGNDVLQTLDNPHHVALFGGDAQLGTAADGSPTLFGDSGDDTLIAGSGDDITLYGGDGNDSLVAAGANDVTLYGGDGNDTLLANGGDNITLFGGTGDDSLTADGGTGVILFGESGNDTLVAGGTNDVTLYGGDGDDSLAAEGGSDITLFGGAGNDSLVAAGANDVTLYGGDGNDSLVAHAGSDITLYGGDGNDSLTADGGTGVTLFGGAGDDTLVAAGANDVTLFGGDGNDSLVAHAGSDITLFGEDGNDSLTADGGTGVTLFDGAGDDTLTAAGATDVTLFGGDGNDSLVANAGQDITLFGGAGDDSLVADGGTDVTLFGGDGNDSLVANAGDNITLFGDAGDDSLTANGGADVTLFGGDGNDSLVANGGDGITLFGGNGDDTLWASNHQRLVVDPLNPAEVGDPAAHNVIQFTAPNDNVVIEYLVPAQGQYGQPLQIFVDPPQDGREFPGSTIVFITLATDSAGAVTTTAADIVDAMNTDSHTISTDKLNGMVSATALGPDDGLVSTPGVVIYGGAGNDTLIADDATTLFGEEGNNTYRFTPNADDVTVEELPNTSGLSPGNPGQSFDVDTLDFSGVFATPLDPGQTGIRIDLSSTAQQQVTLNLKLTVHGTSMNVIGTSGADLILTTPTVTVTDSGGTYNGTPFAATATVQGADSLEGVTPTLEYYALGDASGLLLTGAPTAAGSYLVVATFAGSTDYGSASVPATFTITPAALTITADSKTKVSGATLPTLTASYSGFVNGDTAASLTTLPTLATSATSASPAGSYAITVSGAVAANYTISYVNGTLTVTGRMIDDSVYVLSATAAGALTLSGNATLKITGVLDVDSSSATAFAISGNAHVSASSINVVGHVQKSGNASLGTTPVTLGAMPVADPLASLPALSGNGLVFCGAINLGGNSSLTICPGIYSQITVSGNAHLTLQPGAYAIAGGGFTVTGNAQVTGSGILIYNAGGNYPTSTGGTYSGLTLGGNGRIDLAPATSGTYAGILIFQPRDNPRALSLSGNAILLHGGTIYAPSALLSVSGNAQVQGSLVVNQLALSGNAASTLTADGADGSNEANTAGQLLAGDLVVYVDNSAGNLTDAVLARIHDAIAAINAVVNPVGVNITEVNDPATATTILQVTATSAVGGAAEGVLGCESAGYITIVSGWNWYTGTDAGAVGAEQYDFQTIVTHELGHALGLGHSTDESSAMYATLGTGEARRALSVADLAIPDAEPGPCGLHAAGIVPAVNALAPPPASSGTPAPQVLTGLAITVLPGAGGRVLVGGEGDDILIGGDGRDVLVGGLGSDRSAESTGATHTLGAGDFDTHEAALQTVLREWGSGDRGRLADGDPPGVAPAGDVKDQAPDATVRVLLPGDGDVLAALLAQVFAGGLGGNFDAVT